MRLDRKQVLATVIPAAVIVTGVVVKWIDAPNAVRDLFRSGRAFAFVAVAALLWIGLTLLLWRLTSAWVRGAVMTAVSVAAVLVLVVPTLGDTVVIEDDEDIAAARVDVDDAAMEPAMDDADDAEPTTPVHVSTGEIVGIDHRAAGTANVFRQPDGTYRVELFEIDVEPGPDYFVWLVPGADQHGTGGGVDLGALRGNVGTQYYDVPAGTEVEGEWTVLIWCRVFAVPIGNATQVPV